MAVMQYIGARYAPLFYEGTNGAEWDQGVPYEPLTIVTYAGFSWTSKKKVPSSVGAPNLNPDYWVNTGNYNEGINELMQAVEDIREDLESEEAARAAEDTSIRSAFAAADTAIKSEIDGVTGNGVFAGKIVVIGDSYAEGYNPDGNVTGWGAVLRNTSGCKGAIIKYQGGCGFARANNNKTFYTLLTEAIAQIPAAERGDYSAVIIGGGYNDNGQTTADIRTGIHNCANYVKNNLPSARCIIAYMAWSREPDTLPVVSRMAIKYRYMSAMDGIRVQYIPDAYMALAFKEAGRMGSDGKHPTQVGQNALAAHILICANGGQVDYNSESPTNVGANLNWYIEDGYLCMNIFGSKFLIPDVVNSATFNGSSINGTIAMDFPFTPPSGSVPYNGVSLPGILNYNDGASKYRQCTVTLRINATGGFNIYIACVNDAGNGWLAASNTFVSVYIPIGVYRWKIDEL